MAAIVNLRWRVACLLFLAFTGCYDRVYPPFVKNALNVPVAIKISYSNGVVVSDTWRPGERGPIGRENATITEVVIAEGNKVIVRLDANAIAAMRSTVSDERAVTWRIELHGLKAVPNDNLPR